MHRPRLHFPEILLACGLALSAAAIAEPPPPPAAPAPQPMPHPNVAARDPASGMATGKRMHKPMMVASQRLEASSISWSALAVDPANRLSSDPEEGGEVASARTKTKPTIGEIAVTKGADVASSKLMLAPDRGTDNPPPSGSATITVARNSCASGQHIKEATIVVRSRTFQLHDVDVTGCTANADGTDSCTLNYASMGG